MNKDHLCLVKFSNKHNIYLKSTLLLEPYIYGGTNGSFYAKSSHCRSCNTLTRENASLFRYSRSSTFYRRELMGLSKTDNVPRCFAQMSFYNSVFKLGVAAVVRRNFFTGWTVGRFKIIMLQYSMLDNAVAFKTAYIYCQLQRFRQMTVHCKDSQCVSSSS